MISSAFVRFGGLALAGSLLAACAPCSGICTVDAPITTNAHQIINKSGSVTTTSVPTKDIVYTSPIYTSPSIITRTSAPVVTTAITAQDKVLCCTREVITKSGDIIRMPVN